MTLVSFRKSPGLTEHAPKHFHNICFESSLAKLESFYLFSPPSSLSPSLPALCPLFPFLHVENSSGLNLVSGKTDGSSCSLSSVPFMCQTEF